MGVPGSTYEEVKEKDKDSGGFGLAPSSRAATPRKERLSFARGMPNRTKG